MRSRGGGCCAIRLLPLADDEETDAEGESAEGCQAAYYAACNSTDVGGFLLGLSVPANGV
jgi:hypothetical protein